MRLLEDAIAEAILSGQIKDGDSAIVDIGDNGEVQVVQSDKRLLLSCVA
jgi:ATP-dependent Clp protease ATP-binding subunit ClpC